MGVKLMPLLCYLSAMVKLYCRPWLTKLIVTAKSRQLDAVLGHATESIGAETKKVH